MSRKKTKKQARADAAAAAREKIVTDWDEYFGAGDLADWQRLLTDLGLDGESYSSKTQCRKALEGVWVNIRDFLDAVKMGKPVHHFGSEAELSKYTVKHKKTYPKDLIPKGSPLRRLLAHILHHGEKRGR
ncbi:hypothetical protein F5X99DRAFT_189537 [Biscogniauxia marginata]|nr:hypothetical protein F5X99DRAFT_189537 [Biscogniauxia marginata]